MICLILIGSWESESKSSNSKSKKIISVTEMSNDDSFDFELLNSKVVAKSSLNISSPRSLPGLILMMSMRLVMHSVIVVVMLIARVVIVM